MVSGHSVRNRDANRMASTLQPSATVRSESGNRASHRRLTTPDGFCLLKFGHCHILCPHDHRYSTSEFVRAEFINCMSFGGITTGTDNVVLERTVISREICCGAFREGIVATKYRQRNRVILFMAKKADPCFLVDCPAFEMRQFKAGSDGAVINHHLRSWLIVFRRTIPWTGKSENRWQSGAQAGKAG